MSSISYKIIFFELDAITRLQLLEDFEQFIAECRGECKLNFENVQFINSSGMLALIDINQIAAKHNVKLIFTGLKRNVKEKIPFQNIIEIE